LACRPAVGSDVDVFCLKGVALDEFAAGLDLIAHQVVKI
jgi:hypothetical protein